MKSEDRKRRFNEAIVNILYPSSPQHEEEQLEPVEALIEGSSSDVISATLNDSENASTSGDEERESETEKLTRAQRKKIRKKKLKEEAVRRGKLIGPLRLTQILEDAPVVRLNASEEELGLGDDRACNKSVKVKHRRMAKRLVKEKQNASASENCNQGSISKKPDSN